MANEITDEMLDVYAVTGTYDDLAKKVKAKYNGNVDRPAFSCPCARGR